MTLNREDTEAMLNIVRQHLRGPTPDLVAFRIAHELETALTSVNGNPKTPLSHTEWDEWATVAEAAKLLNCSERRVRQIAPAVGGVKRAGAWWLPRSVLPTED